MKILMLSNDQSALRGGSAFSRRLLDYGTKAEALHVVVGGNGKHEVRDLSKNVTVHAAGGELKIFRLLRSYRTARRILREEGAWVITAQDPFEHGLVAWLLSKRVRHPFELQVHTDFASPYFADSALNRLRSIIARFLLTRAHAVRVVSERIARSVRAIAREPSVVPIFTELRGVPERKGGKKEFRVLFVGRLEPEKDVVTALSAFAQLPRDIPARLIVAGEGREEARLRALSKKHGIEERTDFRGFVDDTASLYGEADALLVSSRYEGYSLVAAEGALAELPVVMTDVGIAGDVLKAGESALICPVGDAPCLSLALARLAGDSALRKGIARRGREAVEGSLLSHKGEFLDAIADNWRRARSNYYGA